MKNTVIYREFSPETFLVKNGKMNYSLFRFVNSSSRAAFLKR